MAAAHFYWHRPELHDSGCTGPGTGAGWFAHHSCFSACSSRDLWTTGSGTAGSTAWIRPQIAGGCVYRYLAACPEEGDSRPSCASGHEHRDGHLRGGTAATEGARARRADAVRGMDLRRVSETN